MSGNSVTLLTNEASILIDTRADTGSANEDLAITINSISSASNTCAIAVDTAMIFEGSKSESVTCNTFFAPAAPILFSSDDSRTPKTIATVSCAISTA